MKNNKISGFRFQVSGFGKAFLSFFLFLNSRFSLLKSCLLILTPCIFLSSCGSDDDDAIVGDVVVCCPRQIVITPFEQDSWLTRGEGGLRRDIHDHHLVAAAVEQLFAAARPDGPGSDSGSS